MSIVFAIAKEPTRVACDRPGCEAFVATPLLRATEREQVRAARVMADAHGWDIARQSDIPFDFCPEHVDPANKHPVTPLYDVAGMPLSKDIPTTDGKGNSLRSKP